MSNTHEEIIGQVAPRDVSEAPYAGTIAGDETKRIAMLSHYAQLSPSADSVKNSPFLLETLVLAAAQPDFQHEALQPSS